MQMPAEWIENLLFGKGLADTDGMANGEVETDARDALGLIGMCPAFHETPLVEYPDLARLFGVAELWLKMEDQRMGLGSFKALGATHAIAKLAAQKVTMDDPGAMATALEGETIICASAGNHGLSVAAGAKLFGAKAVVVLSDTVPEGFAERLREKGAEVVRAGSDYEASMEASKQMAEENGWFLLSDGSWDGYSDPARNVMEGYLIMGHEVAERMDEPPTHVFLQAGVGGLAAACAASARERWGKDVILIVVEPSAAPALIESVKAGKPVETTGPVSSMGRLDCKTPSHLALKYLAREADYFVTLDDGPVEETVLLLQHHDLATTPSGAAGVAALQQSGQKRLMGLDETSRVLCYISEGAA